MGNRVLGNCYSTAVDASRILNKTYGGEDRAMFICTFYPTLAQSLDFLLQGYTKGYKKPLRPNARAA